MRSEKASGAYMDVLLVGDHPYVSMVVLERLTDEGFAWEWVSNGVEAASRFSHAPRPEVVLSASEPQESLHDCLRLRALWPDARFVHAGPSLPVAPRWLELIPGDPLDVDLLVELIKELCGRRERPRLPAPLTCPACRQLIALASAPPRGARRLLRVHLMRTHQVLELDAHRAAQRAVEEALGSRT